MDAAKPRIAGRDGGAGRHVFRAQSVDLVLHVGRHPSTCVNSRGALRVHVISVVLHVIASIGTNAPRLSTGGLARLVRLKYRKPITCNKRTPRCCKPHGLIQSDRAATGKRSICHRRRPANSTPRH